MLEHTKSAFLIFVLYLISFNNSYSQNSYSGKVLDPTNNSPVSFAYILSTDRELISMTDIDGTFKFESDSNNFIFYCMGYDSLQINAQTISQSIYLTPKLYKINEAVITSSKVKTFKQKFNLKKVMPWDHLLKIYSYIYYITFYPL